MGRQMEGVKWFCARYMDKSANCLDCSSGGLLNAEIAMAQAAKQGA